MESHGTFNQNATGAAMNEEFLLHKKTAPKIGAVFYAIIINS